MKRAVKIFQVDAFTGRPFGGNPARVVLDAEGLTEEQMKKIAAEMNVANGQPMRVRVGGHAVTILSGTIRVE